MLFFNSKIYSKSSSSSSSQYSSSVVKNNKRHNCVVTMSPKSSSSSSSTIIINSISSVVLVFQIFLVIFLICTSLHISLVDSCNEAVCASIVSKCTLTQSCKCEMKNCTCCKECFNCLSYLYSECCSCVELCPKPNITNQIIMHSQVGDLKEPMPDLFNILTEETDTQGRWTTFTFPIDIDQKWFQPKPETPPSMSTNVYTIADGKITIDPTKDIVTVNCTVAYMSQCMPLNKCKNSCHSMGSTYFRWFHNGCCECVGTCINYGINESRCSECSTDSDDDDDDDEETPSIVDNETPSESSKQQAPTTSSSIATSSSTTSSSSSSTTETTINSDTESPPPPTT